MNQGGDYYPVVPLLAKQMDNEMTAVVLQYVLMAIMGYGYAVSSSVFRVEQWGIAKRTVIHYLIITIVTLPIAYICYWMRHSFVGVLSYFGIFTIYYLIGWLAQMFFWSRKIRKINEKLKDGK